MRLDSDFLRDPWVRTPLALLTIIAALHLGQLIWSLISQVVDLLVLFVVAWLISFVLQPAVTALTRLRGVTRTLAVVIVYLALLLVLVITGTLVVPTLAAQSALAAEQIPLLGDRFESLSQTAIAFLRSRGILIQDYTDQLLRPLEAIGPMIVSNALAIATGTASVVFQIIIVIVISLYLMLDGARIGAALILAVPRKYRDDFIFLISSVYRAFGGFLRGQIIQSLVYGLGVGVVMLVTGLPFVALTSVLAGLAIFVPFIGPPLSLLPAVAVALTVDLGKTALVLVLTLIVNSLVVNVVQPKVMSQQIGLHPIVVLASVLIGSRVAGPWGALFGVPIAAVAVAMVSFYRLNHNERREVLAEVTGTPDASSSPAASPPGPDAAAAPK